MKNLQKFRDVYGLTQVETANLFGVVPISISRWENGEGEPPKSMAVFLEWLLTSPLDRDTKKKVKEKIVSMGGLKALCWLMTEAGLAYRKRPS